MSSANGRVLVIAAHPDDPDFLAGGTIARFAKEGREIAYVIVTNGNKGSGDRSVTSDQLIPIREKEQRSAAQVLGVRSVEFLGYEDGEVEDTRNLRRDITREIRRWRPDRIITLSPYRTYNNFPGWHRDHRATARVVLDCVYPLARDHLSFPELATTHEPHKVREVYLIQWEKARWQTSRRSRIGCATARRRSARTRVTHTPKDSTTSSSLDSIFTVQRGAVVIARCGMESIGKKRWVGSAVDHSAAGCTVSFKRDTDVKPRAARQL